MTRYSWTQPACAGCYAEHFGDRNATALRPEVRKRETCVYCGRTTESGIYVRISPETAPFPTIVKS